LPDPRKSYHHGDLANALVEVATAIISEVGIENLSLREVARRAGVSPGAPFRHFPTREALLAAIAGRAMQRLVEAVDAGLVTADADDPLAGIEAVGLAYLEWVRANPTHFAVISQRALIALSDEARQGNGAIRERMLHLLITARSNGQMRQDADIETVLLSCRALVYGLGRMFVDGHFPEWQPEGDPFDRMRQSLSDFIRSLRAQVSPD
jgi:AcrR family transcriptional regulator